jgi:hypothetical protein
MSAWLSWAFLPSRVFSLGEMAAAFTATSPLEVPPPGDESTFGPLSRVLLPHEVGLPLSRLPTLLGFAAL